MKKQSTQQFTVYANLKLEIGLDIEAETFEQALEKAKTLKERDFVTIEGEFCDGEIELYGLYKNRS